MHSSDGVVDERPWTQCLNALRVPSITKLTVVTCHGHVASINYVNPGPWQMGYGDVPNEEEKVRLILDCIRKLDKRM